MENNRIFGPGFVFAGLVFFLVCGFTQAKDPTANANLSPFQQWRSAYDCLQNTSNLCPGIYELTEGGWVNVSRNQTDDYCKNGCFDHTKWVITCVYYCKRDYVFRNGATIKDINYTVANGCLHGFNGTTYISSSGKILWSKSMAFITIAATWILYKSM
ncbi:hypothetical protein AMTRI_Chr08g168400 [Amborella trichopoda]